METYQEILAHYLEEAEKKARTVISSQMDVVYPGEDPDTSEVLMNMPQRYLEMMAKDPGSKKDFLDKMLVQTKLDHACNLLRVKNMLPAIEVLSKKELAAGCLLFLIGTSYGTLKGRDPDLFEALKPLYHAEGQAEARKHGHEREKQSEREKAEPAIQWMVERWGKGEDADHAAFSSHTYDRFNLGTKGISLYKFRSLAKEAAYKHFPHKVRGTKKPPVL